MVLAAWFYLPGLYRLQAIWLKGLFFLVGIPVLIKKQQTALPGGAVYVCNHFSSLDNLAVYLCLDEPFSVLGLEEIGRLPLYGYMFSRMHILFDRKDARGRVQALLQAGQRLEEGDKVVIAAEGGIKSLEPPALYQPFEDGAFILAIKKQVPLVPLVFKSTYRMLPEFPLKYFYRVPFEAEILAPINTRGLGLQDIPLLKKEVYQQMSRCLQGMPVSPANLAERSRWNLIREFR